MGVLYKVLFLFHLLAALIYDRREAYYGWVADSTAHYNHTHNTRTLSFTAQTAASSSSPSPLPFPLTPSIWQCAHLGCMYLLLSLLSSPPLPYSPFPFNPRGGSASPTPPEESKLCSSPHRGKMHAQGRCGERGGRGGGGLWACGRSFLSPLLSGAATPLSLPFLPSPPQARERSVSPSTLSAFLPISCGCACVRGVCAVRRISSLLQWNRTDQRPPPSLSLSSSHFLLSLSLYYSGRTLMMRAQKPLSLHKKGKRGCSPWGPGLFFSLSPSLSLPLLLFSHTQINLPYPLRS